MTELIGTCGSLFILVSMCFSTRTKQGTIALRALNLIGSIVYIYYGILLNAFSVVFLNACMVLVNAHYVFREFKQEYLVEDE